MSLTLNPGSRLDPRRQPGWFGGIGEVSLASASTVNLWLANSEFVAITGTTTITSFGYAPKGFKRYVRFTGALTLTYNATSLTIPGAANKTTAAGDALVALSLGAGNWQVEAYWAAAGGGGGGVTTLNGQTGAVVILGEPGGRLTLTSLTPVLGSTVSGATTVYYTPYKHNWVLIYDGTNFIPTTFSELSQATTDTTKSPAAVAASKIYDIFVWNDSGTIRATRGPAWTNDSTRSLNLERINGIWLNQASITNGPAADRGTWVGTIRSNGSSTIDYIFGGAASGGTAAWFGVWNLYNRVNVATQVNDTVASFTVAGNTLGAYNAGGAGSGLNNRVSVVVGLQEDFWSAIGNSLSAAGAAGNCVPGIGYDSTSVMSSLNNPTNASSAIGQSSSYYVAQPGVGFHYFQFLAYSAGAGTSTFYSGGVTNPYASGLTVNGRL